MEGEKSREVEGDEAEVGEGGAGGGEGAFGCWSEGDEVVEGRDGGEFVVLRGVGDGDGCAPEDGSWMGGRGGGKRWWWRNGGNWHAYRCVKGNRCVAEGAGEGQGSGEGCLGGGGRALDVEVVEHFGGGGRRLPLCCLVRIQCASKASVSSFWRVIWLVLVVNGFAVMS